MAEVDSADVQHSFRAKHKRRDVVTYASPEKRFLYEFVDLGLVLIGSKQSPDARFVSVTHSGMTLNALELTTSGTYMCLSRNAFV